jgi:hypothetical protein
MVIPALIENIAHTANAQADVGISHYRKVCTGEYIREGISRKVYEY